MNNRLWKWIFRLFAVGALGVAVGAIALQLLLPAIVRSQVRNVLNQVGLRGAKFDVVSASIYGVQIGNLHAGENHELDVSSAKLDYAPVRAIGGRIDSLRVERANFVFDLDRGRVTPADAQASTKPSDFFSAVDTKSLPLWRIELADCSVTLVRGGAKYIVRIDGWMWREEADRARVSLTFRVAGAPAWLDGRVDFEKRVLDFSAGASDVDLAQLMPFVPEESRKYVTEASGLLKLLANVTYSGSRIHPQMSMELRDGNIVTSPDYGIELRGVHSKVALSDLNPIKAEPGQIVHVDRLKVNDDITLEHAHIEFGVDRINAGAEDPNAQVSLPATVLLNVFKFNWAGGEISSAGPVVINPRQESVAIDLKIRHVGLNEFLKLVSSGRASGNGALSGDLPIQTRWPRISFGTGQIRSDGPGEINFGQQVNDLANTVAQSDARLRGQKEQLIAALMNFRYDQIVFEFERTADGLQVMSRITGRGTKGTKTPIDLTIRYNGLEEALNAYLGTTLRVRSSED